MSISRSRCSVTAAVPQFNVRTIVTRVPPASRRQDQGTDSRDWFSLASSIRATGSIAKARYRHHQQKACSPLAEGILLLHLLDSRFHGHEPHPFSRITNCSVSLSRFRFATCLRNRE